MKKEKTWAQIVAEINKNWLNRQEEKSDEDLYKELDDLFKEDLDGRERIN